MAYLDVGRQILQILKDNFETGTFRGFFLGDPQLIGKSSLPAIVVEESADRTTVDYTQMDTVTKTIIVKVIFDKRDDYGASDTVDTTFAKIRDIIDGRDPLTGQYLPKTLKSILRTGYTLSNEDQPTPGGPQPYVVDQDLSIRYYLEQRPENTYTQEGRVTMTVKELVIVPNRF